MSSVKERLDKILNELGERPVTLVAVTKHATMDQMLEAYEAGVRHFGENKVQDALKKMETLPGEVVNGVSWHLIGHLQSNKVNKTLGRFGLIHSIDSVELARDISLRNVKANLVQPVLMQVNITQAPTKHGFSPAETADAVGEIKELIGIRLCGLMTMADANQEEHLLRKTFCGLRDLRDRLADEKSIPLPELSMGMTMDYIHAIPCGATIIRLGSALFSKA